MNQRRPPASSRPARKRPPRPAPVPRPRGRGALWRWRRSLFVVGLVGVAATGGVASVVFNIKLPPENPLRQTSFVCAADVTENCGPDNAIATFSAEEDRINVPLDQVPKVVVNAVLATEDRGFYKHGGVDPVGIARALFHDVRGSGAQQGGSTITQQYVKNVYLTSERSITRKVKEAILAVKLERELDKNQILERYLNTIYFGRGAYGVGAASRAYFGKDVRTIGLPEAAYLAGLIRAPEAADAVVHPEEASRRRRVTLDAMVDVGDITPAERDAADAVPWAGEVTARRDRTKLDVDPRIGNIGGTYFIEAVRQQVAAKYGDAVLYGGGLRIYVTLDPAMQKAAWNAVTTTLNQPDDPSAALVAVDDKGQVKAMIGGRDYQTQKVNYALGSNGGGGAGRQAGSSFKPFALASAVQQGISLNSKFAAPAQITLPKANNGKDWVVHNYADAGQGTLDLVDATRESSNTAFAQLMLQVGPQNVVDLAHKMGVSAKLSPVNALVLGSEEVSPMDMAVGFSTFANRGVHNDPDMVAKIEQVDENGHSRLLEQARPSADRVLTAQESDLVTYALRQVVTSGTGHAANFGKAAAGKTGTTNKNANAWFVGFTPKLTASVWMGYDNPPGQPARYMDHVHGIEVTGGTFPAQIWNKFMRNATQGMDTGSFTTPKSFPGKILNAKLVLTPDASSSTSSTSTVPGAPGASTSTSTTFPIGFPFDTTSTTTKPGPTSSTTTMTVPPPKQVCPNPAEQWPHCTTAAPP
jgi:penicillin-binding protein 1A